MAVNPHAKTKIAGLLLQAKQLEWLFQRIESDRIRGLFKGIAAPDSGDLQIDETY